MSSPTCRVIAFFRDGTTSVPPGPAITKKDAHRQKDLLLRVNKDVVKVEIVDVCSVHSSPAEALHSGLGQLI